MLSNRGEELEQHEMGVYNEEENEHCVKYHSGQTSATVPTDQTIIKADLPNALVAQINVENHTKIA